MGEAAVREAGQPQTREAPRESRDGGAEAALRPGLALTQ
jgi:hypothetical protein